LFFKAVELPPDKVADATLIKPPHFEEREKLAAANPLVQAAKVERI